jgi:DNA-binding XRE family transcriptional regulator
MKATKNKSVLPLRLRQAIAKLGADIAVARRKRSLTIGMMAERIGVHKNTYLKVEKGDPTVSFGIYAMALFVLGLSDALTALADPGRDDTGLLPDADHLPKRVRAPKEPQATFFRTRFEGSQSTLWPSRAIRPPVCAASFDWIY